MLTTVCYQPVYAVCVSPAPVGVCVPVSSVNERVLERPADVVGGQTSDRRHHVTRELSDTQRSSVLTPPPVMLRSENTREDTYRYKLKK